MSLPPLALRCAALLLAGATAPAFGADTPDASVMYRCPGNDYKNTITAKEAEKLGCKRIEGAPVTIIQMTRPRGAAVTSGAGASAVHDRTFFWRLSTQDAVRQGKWKYVRKGLVRNLFDLSVDEREGDPDQHRAAVLHA